MPPAQTPAQLAAAEAAAGLNATQKADVASGTPYTPAEVSAAQTTTTPTPSPFSSSNAVVSGIQASTAASTAGSALSTPASTPAAPTSISIDGANYQISNGQFQMPNTQAGAAPGSTTTYQTSSTPPAPGQVPAGIGYQYDQTTGLYYWATPATSSSGSASISAPAGYTYSAPDTSGNQTVSGQNGQSYSINFTTMANDVYPNATPAQIQQATTSYTTNMTSFQASVAALGSGYSMTVAANGDVTVTGPGGVSINVGASTILTGQGQGQLSTLSTAVSTANSALQSQLSALAAQHEETLNQLNEEMLAAQQEEGAVQGVVGGGTSGATSYFQNLIDEENSNYESQVAAAQTQNQQAIETATSNAQSALDSIDQKAQSALQSSASSAMTQFNTAASGNYLSVTLPNGMSWSDVENNPQAALDAGLSSNATIAGAIQQGVNAGLTPAQALGQIATAQSANLKAGLANAQTALSGFYSMYGSQVGSMTSAQIMAATGSLYSLYGTQAGITSQDEWVQFVQSQAGESLATAKAVGEGDVITQMTPAPGTSTDPNATVPTISAGYSPGQINAWLSSGSDVSIKGVPTSQAELLNEAEQYMLTGSPSTTLLSKGLSQGQAVALLAQKVQQIQQAYGISGFQLADIQTEYSNLSSAQQSYLKIAFATQGSIGIANANLTLAQNAEASLAQSSPALLSPSTFVNNMSQFLAGNFTPNPQLAGLDTYIYTFAREYGKVTSGSAASAQGLTNAQISAADELISAAQNPAAFSATVSAMQNDMNNVVDQQANQVNTFAPDVAQLLGYAGGGTGSGATTALSAPGSGSGGGGNQQLLSAGYTQDANGNYVSPSGQIYQDNGDGTVTLIGNSGYSLGNSNSASAWPGFTTSQ